MKRMLEKIIESSRHYTKKGNVATYIPELSNQNSSYLGVCLCDTHGKIECAGDTDIPFTIQSISKVAAFICALEDNTIETLLKKISFYPSNEGFNSIGALETHNKQKPLNPMINSGAIVTISLVKGATLEEKFARIFSMIMAMTSNPLLTINHAVFTSEKETGYRNKSLAYFMKSTNIIELDDIEGLLDVYFKLCSVDVTAKDLARFAAVLANKGKALDHHEQLFSEKTARIVKTVLTLCGMYDASGDFAVEVGLPAKSGVGGGIIAIKPNHYGIGCFSPALDEKGNSVASWQVLKKLSEALDLNIF
ncbi:MAG: glutaminase A [Candidatus Izemoplasmataceae bacterium]